MVKSKLYTATGDKGTTSLVGGQRISKNSPRIEAYGTIDELNAFIGVLSATLGENFSEAAFLTSIQNRLFDIGAYLATDNAGVSAEHDEETAIAYGITSECVEAIECQIDLLDSKVPPLCKFLLPGGSLAAAQAHVCRTVARRAERRVINLQSNALVAPHVLKYINRLSDYFFVLARFINTELNVNEIFWRKQ